MKIKGIVTIHPEDPDSMLYHTQNTRHVARIAESMGLEWVSATAERGKEEETLAMTVRKLDADLLVSGGIRSDFQRRKFEKIASEHGMNHYSPIWGWTADRIYSELLRRKIESRVVGVAALGLSESWLGVVLDQARISDLMKLSSHFKFDVTGEGGDLDTFTVDAPLYKDRLMIDGRKIWDGYSGRYEIERIEAVPK